MSDDAVELVYAKPRLVRIAVTGLLDAFDHLIEFPSDWEFVIIFGANGVGKTRLLELVRAASELNTDRILNTPFRELRLDFSDGSTLTFDRHSLDNPLPLKDDHEQFNKTGDLGCDVTLSASGQQVATYVMRRAWDSGFTAWLERSTSWMQIGVDLWQDRADGEVATTEDVYRRYGGRPPRRAPRSEADRLALPPEEIARFVESIPIHLIETQRLLTAGPPGARDPWDEPRPPSYVQTVTQHSDHLRKHLADAVTQHSRLSQQLDRTFPKRVIDPVDVSSSEQSIRDTYAAQSALRARLATFSLIDAQGEVDLPDQRLDEFAIKALATYLSDTEKKLAVFTGLLEKLELFVDIMNARLVRKTVSIDVNKGITVRRDDDGPEIPTESLSSGEQHEMVLVYDLLFRTEPGSVVLVDEPEISLHVAWQEAFLHDIMRIAQLSALRFVVATHSPQIIGEWWSRTNELSVR